MFVLILYIYKQMWCLFVCGDKRGRAGWPRQTPAHNRSFSVSSEKATVVVSVCVGSAWKILPVTARSLWSFPDVTSSNVTSSDVTDSREKRNQGQSDFLRQKI